MAITQIRLSEQALDLSLTTAKIADLAVTTAKINDLAVTTGKLNDLAVTTAKIAGGAVTIDKLNDFRPSAGTLLVLNIAAGSVRDNNVVSTYAGSTLTMAVSATNYVEVNSTGTVSSNTTGFTSGRYPIATVVTDATTITAVNDKRTITEVNGANATVVVRETPTGDLDGVDVTYTLANTPIAGSEEVFLNGVLQNAGGNDYSISGATITFTDAPVSTDKILVNYRY